MDNCQRCGKSEETTIPIRISCDYDELEELSLPAKVYYIQGDVYKYLEKKQELFAGSKSITFHELKVCVNCSLDWIKMTGNWFFARRD